MVVTLDSKRRVTISAAVAPASPGDQFEAKFDPDEDQVILKRIKRRTKWMEIWKQCPVLMDELPARSRELPKKPKL